MRPPIPLLGCLVVLLLAVGGCARAGGEPFQPTLTTALALEPGATIGQTVNPAGDAVQAVDLQVATYTAAADPDGILTVALREPDGGAVLDTAQIAGEDLADATWVRASFGTAVPVGDVVLVEASWQGDSPLALWANTPPPGPGGELVNDPYPAGQLVIGGRPVEGDLAFRVHGAGGPAAGIGQVVEVARSTGARLAEEPVFTALWALALLGCTVLAVSGWRRRA